MTVRFRYRSSRSRIRPAVAAFIASVLPVLIGVGGIGPHPARAESAPFATVGTFEPMTPPGYAGGAYANNVDLYPEPASRRLYVLGNDGWLFAQHLDTFAPLGNALNIGSGVTAALPDAASGSLYLGVFDSRGAHLDAYGVRNGAVVRLGSLDLNAALRGTRVVGMYRAPGTSLLWVLADSSALTSAPGIVVAELDVAGIESGGASVHWSSAIPPQCAGTIHANGSVLAGFGYVARPNDGGLYFGCGNGTVLDAQSAPVVRGIGRLSVKGVPSSGTTTPGGFDLFPRSGDFAHGDSIFDPGSGRFVISAYSPVGTGVSATLTSLRVPGWTWWLPRVGWAALNRVRVSAEAAPAARARPASERRDRYSTSVLQQMRRCTGWTSAVRGWF